MDAQAPRILLVRLSAIGDVVHGLPVLCALRERFPRAFIGWIVEGRGADLLRGHPALDEVIAIGRKWLKSPRTVWQVRRRLKALCFDTTIDLQGLTKSAIAAWLSGARRRIGLTGKDGRELSTWLNNELVVPTAIHVIDRTLELLHPLGIDRPAVRFDLPEMAAAAAAAAQILADPRWRAGFAVVNPGAGWKSKLWMTERFAAVAAHLGGRWQLPTLVVWAGPDERRMADEIVAASGGVAWLAPPTTLTELAALARRARLFIASDTGPLHIAAAVGTPCVGLFGPMPAERNGPYGPDHLAIQAVCLQGTSRQRRSAGPESMQAIGVERVAAACDEILSRAPGAKQCA